MVDIQALNALLVSISVVMAVAIVAATAAIAAVWSADRRRRARQVAGGLQAVENHLAEAAKDRASY
jgi:type II secretory pathway pseudopilin PulG